MVTVIRGMRFKSGTPVKLKRLLLGGKPAAGVVTASACLPPWLSTTVNNFAVAVDTQLTLMAGGVAVRHPCSMTVMPEHLLGTSVHERHDDISR